MNDAEILQSEHPYERPHVERVLTPEALAREVQYAGQPSEVTDAGD